MAKGNGRKMVLDIPVEFGGVSIGDATARLGVKIDRKALKIVSADEIFCGHRLTGRVILGGDGDSQGQTKFLETDETVEAAFDVKRIGANSKEITTGLTFSLADVEIADLAKFSKGSGRLIVDVVAELPDDVDDDDDDSTEALPGTLKADGPWREVPLADLFHGSILKALKKAKITTVGELADWTAKGDNRLFDLDGIGEGKAEQIENRMLEFWKQNPDAADQQESKPSAAANGRTGNWKSAPLSALGLLPNVIERFTDMKVTTCGGLQELIEAIGKSEAVWPKGIGEAKAEDITKRLDDYRDKHREEPAAT